MLQHLARGCTFRGHKVEHWHEEVSKRACLRKGEAEGESEVHARFGRSRDAGHSGTEETGVMRGSENCSLF